MKKFLLTLCAAALISIAGIAQQQDKKKTENTNYQTTPEPKKQTPAEQRRDSTINNMEQEAERQGENLREGAERTGNEIERGAEETGQDLKQGAERTGDQMKDKQSEDSESSSGSSGSMDQTDSETDMPYHPVEVVDAKEGPNHEVVYRYQGELYYVDREQKKMVKVEESELRDSKHKTQIKEGNISTAKKGKNKKSKG